MAEMSESTAERLASALEELSRQTKDNTEAIAELVLKLPGPFDSNSSSTGDTSTADALLAEIRDAVLLLATRPPEGV